MTDSIIYIEGIFICSFFILILAILTNKFKNQKGFSEIMAVYILIEICSLLDIAWVFVDGKLDYIWLNKLLNIVFMSVFSFFGYFWLLHVIRKMDDKNFGKQYRVDLVLAIFPTILTILNIISYKYGITIVVDEDGFYSRGVLNPLIVACVYGYCTLASVLCFVKVKNAKTAGSKKEFIAMGLFVIPSIVCGLIQAIAPPGLPLTYFGVACSAIIYYSASLENLVKNREAKVNNNLINALNAAKSANESKSRFLFNMSHDIRTPMNSVLGFANIAKKNIDDKERVDDALTKLESAGNVLLSLINEILDMSKVETGEVVIEPKPCDIKEVNKEIMDLFSEMAIEKEIDFVYSEKNIVNKYVYADIFNLKRCVGNIISNALKYTHSGGKVDFTIVQDDVVKYGYGTYKYIIHDTGIGISSEFIENIFDQFSRERSATESGVNGAGLGLAITKKLIEMMDGKVSVTSEVGFGSTFIVEVPLRIMENPKEFIEESMNVTYDLSGKRVLLAEDNKLNREIVHEVLEDVGMVVEDAEDGVVAINMFKDNGPNYYDLVLMDIQMPNMDGYEATIEIRNIERRNGTSEVPIIAVSANAFFEDKKKALDAGMNAHISKPINLKELKDAMSKYVKN